MSITYIHLTEIYHSQHIPSNSVIQKLPRSFGADGMKPDLQMRESDVVRSAVGFAVFTTILSSWALTFAIGGDRLFGPVWDQLVMYNLAERLGLTGWS
ncbi:probable gamma-secretase subunit PEN-2 [Juglans microcarpa x Juglans regia]|uniref:probable gamma-secretase subunit PEN-2 n=1 Tax=Juglans microcarpa x Juglans regia TaxID=2249226 RepID=UPI001B7E6430|nr:probable gamma-secretase subunit PEN-2 [Juglans microcarpa x Juglans regia]